MQLPFGMQDTASPSKHHQSGTSGFGTGGREIRVLRRAAYRGMYGRLLLLRPQILRLLQCHDGISQARVCVTLYIRMCKNRLPLTRFRIVLKIFILCEKDKYVLKRNKSSHSKDAGRDTKTWYKILWNLIQDPTELASGFRTLRAKKGVAFSYPHLYHHFLDKYTVSRVRNEVRDTSKGESNCSHKTPKCPVPHPGKILFTGKDNNFNLKP